MPGISVKTLTTTTITKETEFVPAASGEDVSHRILKVYRRGTYNGEAGRSEPKPWITLNTRWLAEAGFHEGDYIDVEVRDGRLVIKKLVEKTE